MEVADCQVICFSTLALVSCVIGSLLILDVQVNSSWIIHSVVVPPVVQNTYKPCRYRKCIRVHIPMHAIFAIFIFFSYQSYLGHTSLLGLQTKPEDRATLSRSSRSSPTTRRHPWAPWWTLLCMPFASTHKKWDIQVCYIRFPRFNHH